MDILSYKVIQFWKKMPYCLIVRTTFSYKVWHQVLKAIGGEYEGHQKYYYGALFKNFDLIQPSHFMNNKAKSPI